MSTLTDYFTDLQMREGLPPMTAEDVRAVQAVIDQLFANKRIAEDHRKTSETHLETGLQYQIELVALRAKMAPIDYTSLGRGFDHNSDSPLPASAPLKDQT